MEFWGKVRIGRKVTPSSESSNWKPVSDAERSVNEYVRPWGVGKTTRFEGAGGMPPMLGSWGAGSGERKPLGVVAEAPPPLVVPPAVPPPVPTCEELTCPELVEGAEPVVV